MRRVELGIGVSVALHAVAIAWAVAAVPARRAAVEEPPVSLIELVAPPPPPPIDVAILDEPAAAPAPAGPAASPPARAAITTERSAAVEVAPPGPSAAAPEPTAPPKPGLLTMRRGPDLARHVRRSYEEAYDLPPGVAPPAPPAPSGKLQPSGGGTHVSNEGTFVAHVDRDGDVTLKDGPAATGRTHGRGFGNVVSDWYYRGEQPRIARDEENINNNRAVDRDTRPDHGEIAGGAGGPTVGISGSFDLTDTLMRRQGIDPYAAKKLKYMDATRDERARIRTANRERQLKDISQLMARNIANVFTYTVGPAAQREALFALWDEVTEDGGDEAIVEATRRARKQILGAIRAHFPAGSATAFTAAELNAMNRRRTSKARFAPYDD